MARSKFTVQTYGHLDTEEIVVFHLIRELLYAANQQVLEVLWDELEDVCQPGVLQWSHVVSINTIVDVVKITLQIFV